GSQGNREGGEPREGGERRRRRRGRRGGRRNRRERFGQQSTEGAEPAPPALEEVQFTPETFEKPTHFEAEPPRFEPRESIPEPQRDPPAPKRRSTVREAAPVVSEDDGYVAQPAPSRAPEPSLPSRDDDTETERPRRSGWWSRR